MPIAYPDVRGKVPCSFFQIAGVGILTTVVASVLNSSGRSELANLATVAGLAIVLLMVVSLLSQLFTNVRTIFQLG